jgi:UDP:flavonoid glycosyltransferase YjiC (YdhE family)
MKAAGVMKLLTAGVPLVPVPLGRGQPDNAARVVHAGAGIRLRKNASVSALRAAVARVIGDPSYRAAARAMAAQLAAERDDKAGSHRTRVARVPLPSATAS